VDEVGGRGAGEEVAVGIVPRGQRNDAGDYAGGGEALCKQAGGLLAGLVFILVRDDIDCAAKADRKADRTEPG
jgi:hypothetical protein